MSKFGTAALQELAKCDDKEAQGPFFFPLEGCVTVVVIDL